MFVIVGESYAVHLALDYVRMKKGIYVEDLYLPFFTIHRMDINKCECRYLLLSVVY